jgi:SH3 domain-containing protein
MPTKPDHLRDAFSTAVVESWPPDADVVAFRDPQQRARWEAMTSAQRAEWLTGQLWHCSDVLPSAVCTELRLPPGATFAKAARSLRKGAVTPGMHPAEAAWRVPLCMALGAAGVAGVVLACLLLVNVGVAFLAPAHAAASPSAAAPAAAAVVAPAASPPSSPIPAPAAQEPQESTAPTTVPVDSDIYVVAGTHGQGLTVRAAPNGRKLGTVIEGGQLKVIERTSTDWWRVAGSGFEGYVSSAYVSGPVQASTPSLTRLGR